MPHKERKVRKMRGSRTHGYGRVGQHRGKGQKGGSGKAGRHKHKWSYVLRYEPDYFKKDGFKPAQKIQVNIGELDEQVGRFLNENKATKKGDCIHIDLSQLGYNRLLGRGRTTHPFAVRVDSCTESAAEKVRKAKGRILGIGEDKSGMSTDLYLVQKNVVVSIDR